MMLRGPSVLQTALGNDSSDHRLHLRQHLELYTSRGPKLAVDYIMQRASHHRW